MFNAFNVYIRHGRLREDDEVEQESWSGALIIFLQLYLETVLSHVDVPMSFGRMPYWSGMHACLRGSRTRR